MVPQPYIIYAADTEKIIRLCKVLDIYPQGVYNIKNSKIKLTEMKAGGNYG